MPAERNLSLYRRIYALVGRIPSGRVATYGQLGRLAGCSPRTVGFALSALPAGSSVPWHRVVNGRGQVSRRSGGDGAQVQQLLLEGEGIRFDNRAQIELENDRWPFPER